MGINVTYSHSGDDRNGDVSYHVFLGANGGESMAYRKRKNATLRKRHRARSSTW